MHQPQFCITKSPIPICKCGSLYFLQINFHSYKYPSSTWAMFKVTPRSIQTIFLVFGYLKQKKSYRKKTTKKNLFCSKLPCLTVALAVLNAPRLTPISSLLVYSHQRRTYARIFCWTQRFVLVDRFRRLPRSAANWTAGKTDVSNKNIRLPRVVLPRHYDVRIFSVLEKDNFTIPGRVSIDLECEEETDRIVFHGEQRRHWSRVEIRQRTPEY